MVVPFELRKRAPSPLNATCPALFTKAEDGSTNSGGTGAGSPRRAIELSLKLTCAARVNGLNNNDRQTNRRRWMITAFGGCANPFGRYTDTPPGLVLLCPRMVCLASRVVTINQRSSSSWAMRRAIVCDFD